MKTTAEEFEHLSDTELQAASQRAQADYEFMFSMLAETQGVFAEALRRRNRLANETTRREREENG